jgi:hypothetical protein
LPIGSYRARSSGKFGQARTPATVTVDVLSVQRDTRLTEGGSHVVELERKLRRDVLL